MSGFVLKYELSSKKVKKRVVESILGLYTWNRKSINKPGLTTYVVSSTHSPYRYSHFCQAKKKKEKNGASRASFGALCVCVCLNECVPQAHTVER